MASELKKMMLEEYARTYRDRTNIVLVGYRGMKAEDMCALRSELREAGIRMHVIRNRIAVRAIEDLGRPENQSLITGPTAIMDGGDPVMMARVAVSYAKRDERLEIRGGIVEGKTIDADGVRALSQMPTREKMIAMLVTQILSSGSNMVGAVGAPGTALAGAIETLVEKGEAA